MKNSLLTFLFLLGVTAVFTQSTELVNEEDRLSEIVNSGTIGIAAGYSIDGETLWKGSKGFRDLDNQIPFDENTVTRLASIAKPMTALAIMQLVEQGKIDLDKPIQTYIPDYPQLSKTAITTRMLLAHASGIGGYKSAKEAQSHKSYPNLESAMKVFHERDLEFEPGTAVGYASYEYVVLGVIIEKVSGESFEDYMTNHIWKPAGMVNTGIEHHTHPSIYKNKTHLFHAKRGKSKRAQVNDLSNRTPGGGFHSTLSDMLLFGDAIITNKLVSQTTLDEMTKVYYGKAEGNPFGLGWKIYVPTNPSEVIGHGGAQTGANTHLFIKPKDKIVVVVLSNTSGTGNESILFAVDLLKKCNALIEQ